MASILLASSMFWLSQTVMSHSFGSTITTSLELFLDAKIFELFNEPHSTGIQIRKIITILHNDVIIAVTDLDDVPSIITQWNHLLFWINKTVTYFEHYNIAQIGWIAESKISPHKRIDKMLWRRTRVHIKMPKIFQSRTLWKFHIKLNYHRQHNYIAYRHIALMHYFDCSELQIHRTHHIVYNCQQFLLLCAPNGFSIVAVFTHFCMRTML